MKITVTSIVLTCHILALCVYFGNVTKGKEFEKAFKIWNKNFLDKCHFEISPPLLNRSALVFGSVLLSFMYGYFFAFQLLLKEKHGLEYLRGKWKLNT
jgi:hypothetical protein